MGVLKIVNSVEKYFRLSTITIYVTVVHQSSIRLRVCSQKAVTLQTLLSGTEYAQCIIQYCTLRNKKTNALCLKYILFYHMLLY